MWTIKDSITYLNALQAGKIIRMIPMQSRGESIIKKPEKIYLDNPNMFDSLCSSAHIGTLRESFVVTDDIEVGFNNKIPLWLFGFLS